MGYDYDLVIRDGMIFDGTGADGFEGDIAIVDGRIVKVGEVVGAGEQEIDAHDRMITPGFVDVHTHYDGQLTWEQRLSPSSWHGVTTAVTGNCGVGFAPCRPDDRQRLIRLMEGVEDIPEVVMAEGLPWNWETFPQFLDAIENKPHDMDFAVQVPHAALRVYAMGLRGANREPATPDDIALMSRLAREAVEAGAIGFSTSRTLNHRTSDGQPTPTLTAEVDELVGIAKGLGAAGKGFLQVVSDFSDEASEFSLLRRMAGESGRPLAFTVAQNEIRPDQWRWLLDQTSLANDDGLKIFAQVCGRPVGVLLGLETTLNPFSAHETYKEIAALPLEGKLARMKDPDFRARMIAEEPDSNNPFVKSLLRHFDKMFPLGDPPDYEPEPETSIGAQARRQGVPTAALAYDYLVETDGKGMLYFPFLNYADGSLDPSFEMLQHPNAVPGLSDGGAHMGMICDGSFPTTLMSFWTRDRTRGPKLPLPHMIKMQTLDSARSVGLNDRGAIRPGLKADINIIDFDNLGLKAPEVVQDLPAGGKRLVQRSTGYDATIVSGVVTYRNGEPTGALPGRLVRGETQAQLL